MEVKRRTASSAPQATVVTQPTPIVHTSYRIPISGQPIGNGIPLAHSFQGNPKDQR